MFILYKDLILDPKLTDDDGIRREPAIELFQQIVSTYLNLVDYDILK
jgi:hypothetical protein